MGWVEQDTLASTGTQHSTIIGVIAHPLERFLRFNNSVAKRVPTPNRVRYRAAIDEIFPTPPFSALAIFLLWTNGALKVGPGRMRQPR